MTLKVKINYARVTTQRILNKVTKIKKGMYGLVVMLSISRRTTIKNIDIDDKNSPPQDFVKGTLVRAVGVYLLLCSTDVATATLVDGDPPS